MTWAVLLPWRAEAAFLPPWLPLGRRDVGLRWRNTGLLARLLRRLQLLDRSRGFHFVLFVGNRGTHLLNSPFAVITAVTTLIPLVGGTSKRILRGIGEGEGIAMKRAQTSAEVLR